MQAARGGGARRAHLTVCRRSARIPPRFSRRSTAIARGDYVLACAQLSKVMLRTVKARNLGEARRVCVKQVRAQAKDLDEGRGRSLASTRVVKVRVDRRRARVTVQRTLYGVKPRATGTAIREGGVRQADRRRRGGPHLTQPRTGDPKRDARSRELHRALCRPSRRMRFSADVHCHSWALLRAWRQPWRV